MYLYHWKTRGNPDVICSIKKKNKKKNKIIYDVKDSSLYILAHTCGNYLYVHKLS